MARLHGPPWTGSGAERRALGHSGALIRSGPPATSGHGSSLAGSEKEEGSTGVPSWASPTLGRRCGSRAMVMKWQWRRSSALVVIKLRERGKRGGGGAVGSGEGGLLL
jgi:hypothetical protein